MRAFISPARIVVLMLVDMYCGDAVVREEDDDYVLQLIGCYVAESYARPTTARQRQLGRWQRASLSVDLLGRLGSLRQPLQRCFLATPQGPQGQAAADVVPLPLCVTLWDDLVARLWLRLTTLDDLEPFFAHLRTRLAPTYAMLRARREHGVADPPEDAMLLRRRSPLGRMVNQACVEFERLAFSGRCQLWEDFARYRHSTRTDFAILWPHDHPAAGMLFDANLTEGRAAWGERQTAAVARVAFDRMAKDRSVASSSDETDHLMGILIDRERFGFRPPPGLRAAADKIIRGGTAMVPVQATLYGMFDAARSGDMTTAYDRLHRFFDLAARSGLGARYGYHSGPLNKAVVQRDFGEHADDLRSMLDAVHAGREMRDYQALRFALLWLYLYARTLPRHIRPRGLQGLAGARTDGQQVLPYVRRDAAAARATGHEAIASLVDARVALGDGRPPLVAMARLRDGSRLVVGSADVTLEGQLVSTGMLFWDRVGVGALAAVHGRAFLSTRHDTAPFDDAVRVASRLALQLGHDGQFTRAKAVLLGRRLGRRLGGRGEGPGGLLRSEGLTSLRPRNTVRHVLLFLAATQAVRARRFAEADELLLRRLPRGGYASCGPAAAARQAQGPTSLDPDLAAQVALLHVASLAGRAEAEASAAADAATVDESLVAARVALDAFEASYDRGVGDLHVVLQAQIARCGLYAQAGRDARVLTFLLRTVQACVRRRYHGLLWEAVGGGLVRVLLTRGEFRAARMLLDAVVPRVLETGHADTAAAVYDQLVDAYMGLAGAMRAAPEAEAEAGSKKKAPYNRLSVYEYLPHNPRRRVAKMKRFLARAWRALGQAEAWYTRAGAGGPVRAVLADKRRVIVAASRRLAAWEAAELGAVVEVGAASGGCVVM